MEYKFEKSNTTFELVIFVSFLFQIKLVNTEINRNTLTNFKN